MIERNPNTRPETNRRRLAGGLLASLSLLAAALVAAADPAAAHDCRGVNPGQTCGDCRTGAHNHRYAHDDSLYCESSGDGGGGAGCNPICLTRVEMVQ